MDSKVTLDCFIVDNGAHSIRLGRAEDFPAEDKSPYIVTPSSIKKDGDSGQISLQVIGDYGQVSHWDAFEALLGEAFYQKLGWPEHDEGCVVLTENTMCTMRETREALTQMLFETFNIRGLYILDTSVACQYAIGKISGITVDIGHSGTTAALVSEGAVVPGTAMCLPQGGRILDESMAAICTEVGLKLGHNQIKSLKEMSALACDSHEEFLQVRSGPSDGYDRFVLPDGQEVSLARRDRAILGEVLAFPSGANSNAYVPADATQRLLGIGDAAFACAMMAEGDQKRTFLGSIFLCGGCSALAGLHTRVLRDLHGLSQSTSHTMTTVPDYMPSRCAQHASYFGAAVVAKSLTMTQMFRKDEYHEFGPAFVHNKC